MSNPNPERARRSVGRPTIETVRDQFITVRVTAIEKIRFLEKARRSGVDPTSYARTRILRGIVRKTADRAHASERAIEMSQQLRQGWHELRRIGVNLNQLARHCNRHQMPPPAELRQLIAALLTVMRRLLDP